MNLLKEIIISLIVVVLFLFICSESKFFPWPNLAALGLLYLGAWKAGVFKGVWR